jgi:hypothetical protein
LLNSRLVSEHIGLQGFISPSVTLLDVAIVMVVGDGGVVRSRSLGDGRGMASCSECSFLSRVLPQHFDAQQLPVILINEKVEIQKTISI